MAKRSHPSSPCPGCPFLRVGEAAVRGLTAGAIRDIVKSDGGFSCHQTVPETSVGNPTEILQCAGFYIYHLVNETSPQMMRIEGRIGMIDVDGLLEQADDVFDTVRGMIKAHKNFSR